jgi:hypothetical protein
MAISVRQASARTGRIVALAGGMLGTLYLIALVITVASCAAKPMSRHSVIRVVVRENDTLVDATPTVEG